MTAPGPLIEDLFNAGHPLDHVVESGFEVGWTRDDVMAVLRERGWDLDGSGRLPRSKRMTVPRGLRAAAPPSAPPKTHTTTTHRTRVPTHVPDPLDGHPLPIEAPTPEEAMAEQAELDVPIGQPYPAGETAAYPVRSGDPLDDEIEPTDEEADEAAREAWAGVSDDVAEPERKRPGRKPLPIEHGSDRGYEQHKRKKQPIPADDACGCQAAHDATLTRRRGPRPVDVVLDADEPTTAPAPAPPTPTAEEIRARVDEMAPRVHPDGSINARFVAIEQTLRTRHGHPSYIAELDGLGKFRPQPEPRPEPPLQPVRELEPAATTRRPGRDLDEWLAGAQRSTSPTVRKHAHIAIVSAVQLVAALDALARAERDYARGTR